MITHIRMKNFKSWEDSGPVALAPLTGFFGTNSSGKSSLLQMLLLLKQTVKSEQILFFGDENSLVNLGDFQEVIHGHDSKATLELEFGCKLQGPHSLDFYVEVEDSWEPAIGYFAFNTVVKDENSKLSVQSLCYMDISGTWEIAWKSGEKHNIGELFINKTSEGNAAVKNCYGTPNPKEESLSPYNRADLKSLTQISSVFENQFDSVYYLGPTRVHPQRLYHWAGTHPKEVDLWGNKAIDALLSARVRQMKTSNKEIGMSIEDKISKWLRKMELAHSFSLGPSGALADNNYKVRIRKSPNSTEVTLADMGHGLADLFPLLVHCYYVPEGSTLILEQPGVHLHPKAQAQLADLFLDIIAERNLQILVESHSEHLLTRLQRRIAEEKIGVDKTALYFCRNNDGASKIDKLDVDELGNIKNWPDNFFGEVMGDMFAMTDAQAKRLAEQDSED